MISAPPSPNKKKLVGGFNPLEKIFSSNWIISPNKGENTIYSKPPPGKKKKHSTPRILLQLFHFRMQLQLSLLPSHQELRIVLTEPLWLHWLVMLDQTLGIPGN